MTVDHVKVTSVLVAESRASSTDSVARLIERVEIASVVGLALTAEDAFEIARQLRPEVAIVDLELSPNCSLVSRISSEVPETRVVVVADRSSPPQRLVDALAAGAVGALYRGEAGPEELARALRESRPGAPVVAGEATGVLLGSYLQTLADRRRRDRAVIHALATAVETRDFGTGLHLHRVTELAGRCMQRIDPVLAQSEDVRYGFMLHDVGKIGIPDEILNKPGPLDPAQWTVMRQHPVLGVRIVESIGFSRDTTDVILYHHERWDGRGYPFGLAGDAIPLTARTFAVADAFDAMTSARPYRHAMSEAQALEIIVSERGKAYDPDIVDLFVELDL